MAPFALDTVEVTASYLSQSQSLCIKQIGFHQDIKFCLPTHAWDTHVHVFDPINYPYAQSHAYSPIPASYSSLLSFEASLSAHHEPQNIVLVQPSPYGTDNSLILDLLERHASKKQNRLMRAISVIDPANITDHELSKMNELGVRGIRVNAEATGAQVDYQKVNAKIMAAATRVSNFKHWKCQIFVSADNWEFIADTIRELPLPVIADHQGGMKGLSALPSNITDVTKQPGFSELIGLAKSGKVFIKISGFYRSSKLTTGGYDDLEPLIKAFADMVPQQLIWASDWPHTGSGSNRSEATKDIPEPFRTVDNGAVLRNIRKWVGPELWHKMTVVTPSKLYR